MSIEKEIMKICSQKNIKMPKICTNMLLGPSENKNIYICGSTHPLFGTLNSQNQTATLARNDIYKKMMPHFKNAKSYVYEGKKNIRKYMAGCKVLYFEDFTVDAIEMMHNMRLTSNALGMDFEFVPFGPNAGKISLCQIANSKKVLLISVPICTNKQPMPTALSQLLSAPIRKVFCAFYSDRRALNKTYRRMKHLRYRNIIDIQKTKFSGVGGIRRPPLSLKSMAAVVLNVNMPKNKELRVSFTGGALSDEQKQYASSDAYITLKIYKKIGRKMKHTLV
jgi:hypothetical protein